MDTKKILIMVLALLVGLVLGFVAGQSVDQKSGYELVEHEVEIQRLKEIVEEFWPVQPEMLRISGTVKEVKTNSLVIETAQVHPLEELPILREISLAEDIVIVGRTERDMEEYMRLEEELIAQIEAGIEPEEWPDFFIETEIALNQIKPGNRILVQANQDIKWSEKFTASKITVQL